MISCRPSRACLQKTGDLRLGGAENQKSLEDLEVSFKCTLLFMKKLSVPEQHQLNIARKTMRMSDAAAAVMGGPNKEEAAAIILKLTGESYAAWEARRDKLALERLEALTPQQRAELKTWVEGLPDDPKENPWSDEYI